MILERNEFTTFENFVFDLETNSTLTENAYRALLTYRDTTDNDDYVVIRINNYYAITKIIDEWQPIEVSALVQPFDDKTVYPLQKIRKTIEWDY